MALQAVSQYKTSLLKWSLVIGRFLSISILIQVLGFLSGILLVRQLSHAEYAFYTISNTLQSTLVVLADVGISVTLYSIGGKVWNDAHRLGQLMNTTMVFRRRISIVSTIIVIPILTWLLRSNGAGWIYTELLCLIVLGGALCRLTNDIYATILKLQGFIEKPQRLELLLNVVRLCLLLLVTGVFPNALPCVLLGSLIFAFQLTKLRVWASAYVDTTAPPSEEDKVSILKLMRDQLPLTIFYCIQGQLTLYLLSVFGSVHQVAEMGALGRITMILQPLNVLLATIAVPRFAKCQDRQQMLTLYLGIVGGLIGVCSGIFLVIFLFPHQVLWLLGAKYSHLQNELSLVVALQLIIIVSGAIFTLALARGWTNRLWVSIPLFIGALLLMIPYVDVGSIKGVTIANIVAYLVSSVPYVVVTTRSFRAQWRTTVSSISDGEAKQ